MKSNRILDINIKREMFVNIDTGILKCNQSTFKPVPTALLIPEIPFLEQCKVKASLMFLMATN